MAQFSAIVVHAAPRTQWSPVHSMQALQELLLLLIHLYKVHKQENCITKKLHEKCIIRIVQVFKSKRCVHL